MSLLLSGWISGFDKYHLSDIYEKLKTFILDENISNIFWIDDMYSFYSYTHLIDLLLSSSLNLKYYIFSNKNIQFYHYVDDFGIDFTSFNNSYKIKQITYNTKYLPSYPYFYIKLVLQISELYEFSCGLTPRSKFCWKHILDHFNDFPLVTIISPVCYRQLPNGDFELN